MPSPASDSTGLGKRRGGPLTLAFGFTSDQVAAASQHDGDNTALFSETGLVSGAHVVLEFHASFLVVQEDLCLDRHIDVFPGSFTPLTAEDVVGGDLAAIDRLLPLEDQPPVALTHDFEAQDLSGDREGSAGAAWSPSELSQSLRIVAGRDLGVLEIGLHQVYQHLQFLVLGVVDFP